MKKLLGLMLITALVSGCDDDTIYLTDPSSGTGSNSGFTAATLSNLAGTWYSSETQGTEQDIFFLQIEPNGDIYNFDYLGDSADNGAFCYQLSGNGYNNQISLTELGSNRFLMTTNYNGTLINSYLTALISDDGQTLALTYQDIFDVDFDGNTSEFQTLSLTLSNNITADRFYPRCNDSEPLAPPETNNQPPSTITLNGDIRFETSQEQLKHAIEGDWNLIWKTKQSLSLANQQNLSGDDIYGAMTVNDGLVTMVSDEYPSLLDSERHVVNFQFSFDEDSDGSQSQWLDAKRIDGCQQRVQVSISEDWNLMAMGFNADSCDHDVQTVYVWEYKSE